MPPRARRLVEEGVVIPPLHLVRCGRADWSTVRDLLGSGPFPSRAVEDNLADLRAAVAANHRGAESLRALAETHGDDVIRHYMSALEARAEKWMRQAFARLPDGDHAASEKLDDGSLLCARIRIEGDQAQIDFSGSAEVHPGNLNATPAIVRSAVMYVLRLLIGPRAERAPLNEGLMHPVTVRLAPGILDPAFTDDPATSPAVVAACRAGS